MPASSQIWCFRLLHLHEASRIFNPFSRSVRCRAGFLESFCVQLFFSAYSAQFLSVLDLYEFDGAVFDFSKFHVA